MVRGSNELNAAAAAYVCVRITDMRSVDLNLLRFDFDLTFAAMLMNADGTIYHRYGGRGPDDASAYLSMTSLAQLLRDTLADHAAYEQDPHPPRALTPQPAIELPALQQRLKKGQQIDCVHCHTCNDAEHQGAVLEKRWRPEDLWLYPDPARIGLTLDRENQARITAVEAGSPAANAGMRKGDVLSSLGDQANVRTLGDVQWALQQVPYAGGKVTIAYRRGKAPTTAVLSLAEGWKRCSPEDYAWRPYKWNLSPQAGFGGPLLTDDERSKLGLEAGAFAFRVQYIADWGDHAERGRAAKAAGLQKGDVVLSFGGRDHFTSMPQFNAWVALTHKVGDDIEIVVRRGTQRLELHYRLPE